jgi:hypothetical protein
MALPAIIRPSPWLFKGKCSSLFSLFVIDEEKNCFIALTPVVTTKKTLLSMMKRPNKLEHLSLACLSSPP